MGSMLLFLKFHKEVSDKMLVNTSNNVYYGLIFHIDFWFLFVYHDTILLEIKQVPILKLIEKLPNSNFDAERAAARAKLGLTDAPAADLSFHQNPDGTVMRSEITGQSPDGRPHEKLSEDQIEALNPEHNK